MIKRYLLCLLAYGCTTVDNSSDNLDITSLPKSSVENSELRQTNIDAEAKAPQVEGEENLNEFAENWKDFFSETPLPRQRIELEQKVNEWKDSGDNHALIKQARAEMMLGKLLEAETTLRQIIRTSPENVDALLLLASIAQRKNRVTAAFSFLKEIKALVTKGVKVGPTFLTRYRYILALNHLQNLESKPGRKILRDLIRKSPSFIPAYSALASSYMANNKHYLAEFIIRRGLEKNTKHPSLINFTGLIYEQKQELGLARQKYEEALQIQPQYPPALINMARLKIKDQEYDAANSMLHQAIQEDSQNSSAYLTLGVLRSKQGMYEKAKIAFEQALELAPNKPENRFNLAILLLNHFNQREDALRMLHEVAQLAKNNAQLRGLASNYASEIKNLGKN